jgi:hypothetical protein
MRRVQRVERPSDLEALTVWRLAARLAPEVALDAEGVSRERLRMWEKRLSRQQRACGCDQGAYGLFVGLLISLVLLVSRHGGWVKPTSPEAWFGVLIVVATTTAGKFAGLALEQRKLRRMVVALRAEWTAHAGASGESAANARGVGCC